MVNERVNVEPAMPNLIELDFTLKLHCQRGPQFQLDTQLQLSGCGITAIYGPSGSGKTTLLRCIAGIERRQTGYLRVNGKVWQDGSQLLAVHKRPLGYVFQEASLFPHLSAQQNLDFAIKRAKLKPQPRQVEKVIAVLGIVDFLDKKPALLSGGERQRIAIARALLIMPELLLMDEPLASLDEQRKQEFLPFLEELQASFQVPILYVSHSLPEITRLANYAVVLNRGSVITQGPCNQVFGDVSNPALNHTISVICARITSIDTHWRLLQCVFSGGEIWLPANNPVQVGKKVNIAIAADDVTISLDSCNNTSILNRMAAVIQAITPAPAVGLAMVKLRIGGADVVAKVTNKAVHQLGLAEGMQVQAQIASATIVP